MNSYMAKKNEIERSWHVVDADGQVLGRLASQIAVILMGKHKPTYTPHVDTGDYVIVLNAGKVSITGQKQFTKQYDWYTGYPGGHKYVDYAEMLERHPERVIEMAVKRMLPKSKLGRKMFKKLKVYSGSEHEHQAQQPKELQVQ